MKKKLLLLHLLNVAFFANAQNVGINTTSPQASLDVKGTERIGGINNYVKYDSATGKIEWVGASLFTSTSQQIIKHSASSEGMYAGGGKLDYRNSTGVPVFFSDWTTGNGYFSGNLGIGVVSPTAKFQIRDGVSGITPFSSARMVVETNNHTYINLLAPDPFETGILFGSGTNAVSGLISYNTSTVPKGFIFNNNGNQTRMVINSVGNVGIGVTDPQQSLSIKAGMNIDQTDLNHGTLDNNVLRFGGSSGEAIGSARGTGDNVYGLDFYAGGLKRMVIANGGNIGIGTTNPAAKLHVSAGDASLALFGPSAAGGSLYVGASGNQGVAFTAQVIASDGNLHIDPASGRNIYLGYFQAREIYLNPNGGNVGVGTTAPAASLEVNGYTKLGSDAPSIKVKKLTGTTYATEGGNVFIPYGVTTSKILSVSVMVLPSTDFWIGPHLGIAGYNFSWTVQAGYVTVTNESNDSANILSKPIRILITYEE